jgi:hypothetical protein
MCGSSKVQKPKGDDDSIMSLLLCCELVYEYFMPFGHQKFTMFPHMCISSSYRGTISRPCAQITSEEEYVSSLLL